MGDDGGDDEMDATRYCICNGLSYGDMIACDDEACETEWFHCVCVGITGDPPEGKWYCDACAAKRESKRGARGGKRKGGARSRAKGDD